MIFNKTALLINSTIVITSIIAEKLTQDIIHSTAIRIEDKCPYTTAKPEEKSFNIARPLGKCMKKANKCNMILKSYYESRKHKFMENGNIHNALNMYNQMSNNRWIYVMLTVTTFFVRSDIKSSECFFNLNM